MMMNISVSSSMDDRGGLARCCLHG